MPVTYAPSVLSAKHADFFFHELLFFIRFRSSYRRIVFSCIRIHEHSFLCCSTCTSPLHCVLFYRAVGVVSSGLLIDWALSPKFLVSPIRISTTCSLSFHVTTTLCYPPTPACPFHCLYLPVVSLCFPFRCEGLRVLSPRIYEYIYYSLSLIISL